jgi:hypothetical protein
LIRKMEEIKKLAEARKVKKDPDNSESDENKRSD